MPASRNRGRRGRSRKRRAAPAANTAAAPEQGANAPAGQASDRKPVSSDPKPVSSARPRRERPSAAARQGGALAGTLSVGERPQAPWHPLPLSELLILVGAIGAIIGYSRGVTNGLAPLVAGIAAVLIGTIDVSLREHLSGYRAHTVLLALLPPLMLHSGTVLLVQALTTVPRWLSIALLPIDAALFWLLFKLLRGRFLDARRERIAGRR